MRIRPATVADIPAIVTLEAENMGVDAWSAGLVAEGVAGALPTVRYLVAAVDEVDDRLAGHAVASVAGDVTELQRVAVDPEHRRAGVASALLDAVVEVALEARSDRLLLEVREDNAVALAFYAARGFVQVDRRRRYYRDGAAAVVLRRPLGRGCGGSEAPRRRIEP